MVSDNKESLESEENMSVNWSQVTAQAILGFFATLFGVFAAFWLQRHRETQSNRTKAIEFLKLVKKELEDNLATLQYLAKSLREREFDSPFFAVRFTNWHTFLDRLPLIGDKLRADMTTIYYELETHDRTVTLYRGLIYALYGRNENGKSDSLNRQVTQHRDALLAQIGEDDKSGLVKSIPPVMQKIDAEIKRLSDC